MTVEGTRFQAQKALDRLLGEIAAGVYRQPVELTLASYPNDQWLVVKEAHVRAAIPNARSLSDYRRAVAELVAIVGAPQLDRINRADVAHIPAAAGAAW